jgi:hypothetical protein
MSCWTVEFNEYLLATQSSGKQSMPLEPEDFKELVYKWATEEQIGQTARASNSVGFVGKDLVYMKVYSKSKGGPRDPYKLKNPWYLKWEKYLEDYRDNAP